MDLKVGNCNKHKLRSFVDILHTIEDLLHYSIKYPKIKNYAKVSYRNSSLIGKIECLRAVSVLMSSGSHFITNADWGCYDGNHKAWFFMEAANKEEALMVVPPAFRKDTNIMSAQ